MHSSLQTHPGPGRPHGYTIPGSHCPSGTTVDQSLQTQVSLQILCSSPHRSPTRFSTAPGEQSPSPRHIDTASQWPPEHSSEIIPHIPHSTTRLIPGLSQVQSDGASHTPHTPSTHDSEPAPHGESQLLELVAPITGSSGSQSAVSRTPSESRSPSTTPPSTFPASWAAASIAAAPSSVAASRSGVRPASVPGLVSSPHASRRRERTKRVAR